jgi:hypothetical protein
LSWPTVGCAIKLIIPSKSGYVLAGFPGEPDGWLGDGRKPLIFEGSPMKTVR